jgi:hypothetical protein
MRAVLETAGERIELRSRHRSLSAVLEEGAAGELVPASAAPVNIRVTVEDTSEAFDTSGWEPLTRGAWRSSGRVIVQNACSSGLDVLVITDGDILDMHARWRPSPAVRAADTVLRSRSRLLLRDVLLQYPAMWWAGRSGRAPLHASVCTLGRDDAARTVMIAGPGGVGKSTLLQAELSDGARCTCDNLCTSDGHSAWGVVEPMRVQVDSRLAFGGRGRRMPHGRREIRWPSRMVTLTPDMLVVLRRGTADIPVVRPLNPEQAARVIVAGTYMAGELRRYWQFASTLALGTGVGMAHPAVEAVAAALVARLPCWEVVLAKSPGARLAALLEAVEPTIQPMEVTR